MDSTRIRGLGWAIGIVLLALIVGHMMRMFGISIGISDEFGRDILSSTLLSTANSLLTATWTAFIALMPPLIVGYFAAVSGSVIAEKTVYGLVRVLDVIPLFLWVAIAYVGFGSSGHLIKLIAISLVALPYVLGLSLPSFTRIARAPFSLNAKFAHTPAFTQIWSHFLPNALPVLAYPFAVIFGLCITFDAALGLLGMGARRELSIGMLMLRAKEQGVTDSALIWSTIGGLLICALVFWHLRVLIAAPVRTASEQRQQVALP
ncbi:hypothetical protein [Parvibaculum sp.]|uniref:hypothetical protein n=1 Tax=Parvibaculum sp. TaxID=2024848 RepID=UPI00261EAA2E|nr:hypothetical protein [Parvibaculum sp.]MCW5726220.1 hypothetical protein [Parvibaculum sp.]